MQEATPRTRSQQRVVFYVPASFQPEYTLPPHLVIHAQSAYYLMHTVITRLAHGEDECARLKMEYLENVTGKRQASEILAALRESGDVQRVRGYMVGEYAFGYLPGKQYRGQRLRRFYPTNPELLARLARQHEQIREAERRNRLPIHEVWES